MVNKKWWKKKYWQALCTLALSIPTLSGLLVNPYFFLYIFQINLINDGGCSLVVVF